MTFGLLAPLTLAALALVTTMSGAPPAATIRSTIRVVDVRGAASLLARGASVLDAREQVAYSAGHLPGAQLYAWMLVSAGLDGPSRGPRSYDAIAMMLSSLGVDDARPTLVYGQAGAGQGGEGHAAWMLAMLGHPDVAMLDGGFDAWRSAGRPVVTSVTVARGGRLTVRLREELRITGERVASERGQLLDVRSAAEFAGSSGWDEARGGHVPWAKNLDWRAVLDEHGRVRSASRVRETLERAGVDPTEPVALVCSNGVRSGYLSAVLMARGVAVAPVLEGGMVAWSADPSRPLARG
jgi:thiosulfate/3-mercaptopyruvate sulfurtransferase